MLFSTQMKWQQTDFASPALAGCLAMLRSTKRWLMRLDEMIFKIPMAKSVMDGNNFKLLWLANMFSQRGI